MAALDFLPISAVRSGLNLGFVLELVSLGVLGGSRLEVL
jgi:hypothetical protein